MGPEQSYQLAYPTHCTMSSCSPMVDLNQVLVLDLMLDRAIAHQIARITEAMTVGSASEPNASDQDELLAYTRHCCHVCVCVCVCVVGGGRGGGGAFTSREGATICSARASVSASSCITRDIVTRLWKGIGGASGLPDTA